MIPVFSCPFYHWATVQYLSVSFLLTPYAQFPCSVKDNGHVPKFTY